MKRRSMIFSIAVLVGLVGGCSYFQKKDEPPPLPTIEESKPTPLKLKSTYFKSYPWAELGKAQKDGGPDTTIYTFKEGDTLDGVAEKEMGAESMAQSLADYNEMKSVNNIPVGEKIVIPNPIIGVSCHLRLKSKKDKAFGTLEAFDTEGKKGDQYQMVFEPNVNGYFYVFRQSPRDVVMLYPQKTRESRKKKTEEPPARHTGKVTAFEQVSVPMGVKGFVFDSKNQGDKVYVFLSLRQIPALEDLKDKAKIRAEDLKDVLNTVKESDIVTDGPIRILRISDPAKEPLGFTLDLKG